MDEQIRNRLAKVREMTKSPNVNEAEKAMELLEKLLSKYNVTLQELTEASLAETLGAIEREYDPNPWSTLPIWQKHLANVLARYFHCISFYTQKLYNGKLKDTICFVGYESDRITCLETYKWLSTIIMKNARAIYGKAHSSAGNSYGLGVVHELQQKYWKPEPKPDDPKDSTEIAIVDTVKQWTSTNLNLGKAKQHKSNINGSAFNAGTALGKDLSLARQCGANTLRITAN